MPQRLRDIPVFRGLPPDQIKTLAGDAVLRNMRARETLYGQNDKAGTCFVVLSGMLRFNVALGRQKATSGLASANDIFGLESLQTGARRKDTAIAGCAAELVEIESKFLKAFVLENPAFQLELLNYTISKLQEKSCHAVQTGHYDAEQRLAAYLISNFNGRRAKRRRPDATLSQADLADYLALTPETLCRKVSKFRRLGWIGGRGNEYVIKEPHALQHLLEQ